MPDCVMNPVSRRTTPQTKNSRNIIAESRGVGLAWSAVWFG
jgi:hypothetical protein